MRARYMDPALGRFVSEDPAGDGNNWFVYCGNDPVNKVDDTGKAVSDVAAYSLWTAGFAAAQIAALIAINSLPGPLTKAEALAVNIANRTAILLFGMAAVGRGKPSQSYMTQMLTYSGAITSMLVSAKEASGGRGFASIAISTTFAYGMCVLAILASTE